MGPETHMSLFSSASLGVPNVPLGGRLAASWEEDPARLCCIWMLMGKAGIPPTTGAMAVRPVAAGDICQRFLPQKAELWSPAPEVYSPGPHAANRVAIFELAGTAARRGLPRSASAVADRSRAFGLGCNNPLCSRHPSATPVGSTSDPGMVRCRLAPFIHPPLYQESRQKELGIMRQWFEVSFYFQSGQMCAVPRRSRKPVE